MNMRSETQVESDAEDDARSMRADEVVAEFAYWLEVLRRVRIDNINIEALGVIEGIIFDLERTCYILDVIVRQRAAETGLARLFEKDP